MAYKVIMPKQGLQMDEGTLLRWLIKEGDPCIEGEPLFEMETDKLVITIDSPAGGTLLKILKEEGETVPITEIIAIIGEPGEKWTIEEKRSKTDAENESINTGLEITHNNKQKADDVLIRISPRAAAYAKEREIDISHVRGTGTEGSVTEKDVIAYCENIQSKGNTEDELVLITPIRKLIGDRLYNAQKSIAQATIRMTVNMIEPKYVHDQAKSKGKRISYNDILIMAVAKSLEEHPYMNSQMTAKGILLKKNINIGVATATDIGLIVPVIQNANKKSVYEIDEECLKLFEAAREHKIQAHQISGSTFTISNLGMFNVQSGEAIVNTPETGILCTGAVKEEVIVEDHQMLIAPVMTMTLSYDHRVLDGADAAKFTASVRQHLQSCKTWCK